MQNLNHRRIAEEIFLEAVRNVLPGRLVRKNIQYEGGKIILPGSQLDAVKIERVLVIGAGKASALMAREIEGIFGERITGGHIIAKYGTGVALNRMQCTEAGHPVPDDAGFGATRKITGLLKGAAENDLVICLFSGGGSSLLADCPEGISRAGLRVMNDLLVKCGANIEEINIVRKHISGIKGGRLAAMAHPAEVISLILSDVPGNMPDVVASGPACPDPSTWAQVADIIIKYELSDQLPAVITELISRGVNGAVDETPKPGDPLFDRVHNYIIGSNEIAVHSAAACSVSFGLNYAGGSVALAGDVNIASRMIIEKALAVQKNPAVIKPACLVFGGETTVKVKGSGTGGRNQHLALLCAAGLKDIPGITILAAGTDGNDGPTDAAGAVVDSLTLWEAARKGIDPVRFLGEFDSWNFFRQTGGHIITGPTGTNVMDLVISVIA